MKVTVRFDHDEIVICLKDNLLISENKSTTAIFNNQETISIKLERELNNTLDNEYEDNSDNEVVLIKITLLEILTTRLRRKIHKPLWYLNYLVLLLGLITSLFVSIQNNNYKK